MAVKKKTGNKKTFNPSNDAIRKLYVTMQDIADGKQHAKECFVKFRRLINEEGRGCDALVDENLRTWVLGEITTLLDIITHAYASTKKQMIDLDELADDTALKLKDLYQRKDLKWRDKKDMAIGDEFQLAEYLNGIRNTASRYFELMSVFIDLYRTRSDYVRKQFLETDKYQRQVKLAEAIAFVDAESPYPDYSGIVADGKAFIKLTNKDIEEDESAE